MNFLWIRLQLQLQLHGTFMNLIAAKFSSVGKCCMRRFSQPNGRWRVGGEDILFWKPPPRNFRFVTWQKSPILKERLDLGAKIQKFHKICSLDFSKILCDGRQSKGSKGDWLLFFGFFFYFSRQLWLCPKNPFSGCKIDIYKCKFLVSLLRFLW